MDEIKIVISGPQASGKTLLLSLITYALEQAGLTVTVGPDDLPAPKATMGPSPAAVVKRVIRQLGLATKTKVVIETTNEPHRAPHPLEPITKADYVVEGLKDPEATADAERWRERDTGPSLIKGDRFPNGKRSKSRVDLDAAREACRQIERAQVAKAAEADRLAESIPKVQIEGMIGNVALKGLPSKAAEIFSVAGGTGWVRLKVWDTHMDRMSGACGALLATARTSAFTPLQFRLQPKAVQAKILKGSK